MFTILIQTLHSNLKTKVWPKIKDHGLEAIMILFCFFLLSFLIVKIYDLRGQKQKFKVLEQIIKGKEKEISTFKNAYDEKVSQVEALKISKRTMKEIHSQQQFEWLLKFENLKKKHKNLENAYQIALNASAKIENMSYQDTVISIIVDTVERSKIISYKDQYTFLKAKIGEKNNHTFQYQIKIPLQIVAYWSRRWFLGRKSWKVEAVSENKNVSISKLDAIVIKKR